MCANYKKNKLLLVSSMSSLKGGGQRSILLLAKYLLNSSVVPIICVFEEGEFSDAAFSCGLDVKIVKLPKIVSTKSLAAGIKFRKMVQNNQIDIIQVESPREFVYGIFASCCSGVKLIYNARVSDSAGFFDKVINCLADAIIAVSTSAARRFVYPDSRGKVCVIYNSVDLLSLPNVSCQSNKQTVKLSYFGQLHPRKGVINLIEAISQINLDLTLDIWGDGCADYVDFLKSKADQKKVFFHGYTNDILRHLNEIDIVVMPAILNEGLSRTVIEAMALGKIVIVSDVESNKEALGEEFKEFTFLTGSSEELKKKLLEVIEKKEQFQIIGRKFKDRAEESFNAELNTKKYEKKYISLVRKNG